MSILVLFFERKFIGIAQKRLGISFLGRNGWVHLPADIVKFWSKNSFKNNSIWGFSGVSVFLVLLGYYLWNMISCVFFLNNFGFSYMNFSVYQIFIYLGYANLTTLYLFFLIINLKSKYAIIGGIRLLIVNIFLEFMFSLVFFLLYIYCGGLDFSDFLNDNNWLFLIFSIPAISLFFLLYSLYESKRAPFDHAESESELVAGHLIEFCGRSLLFFFFSEYIHLYFCMFIIFLFCFGGISQLSILQFFFSMTIFMNFTLFKSY